MRAGEKDSEKIKTEKYDKEKFKTAVRSVRGLTTERIETAHIKMIELCAKSGIAITFVPEFGNTHIWGITRWLTSEKALIVMSLRYKMNDHFWFTFFHEAGHILLHGKKDVFIDKAETEKSRQEDQANEFACDTLIDKNSYRGFNENNDFSPESIRIFAGKVKIHPGIVAGRLAHDKKIPHPYAAKFKEKFEFVNK